MKKIIPLLAIIFIFSCSSRYSKYHSRYFNNEENFKKSVLLIHHSHISVSTINDFNRELEKNHEYVRLKDKIGFKYVETRGEAVFFVFDGFPPDTIWGICFFKKEKKPFFSKQDLYKKIDKNWYYFFDV